MGRRASDWSPEESSAPATILFFFFNSIVQLQVVLVSTSKSLSLFLQSLGGDVAKTNLIVGVTIRKYVQ